jgi:hypothetical protein
LTIRKRLAVTAAVLAFGASLGVLPANPAAAAYTCHISVSDGWTYAGYYSGTTVQPSTTGVSAAGIEAQCLLRNHGYSVGTIDGVFGSQSQAAAKAFQRKMNGAPVHAGLTVDGKVGPQTWPLLRAF